MDNLLDEYSPRPKVGLRDLTLALISGLEVLERVRQQATPIVMFSSSTRDCDLRAAYALGADSYLVKPQT